MERVNGSNGVHLMLARPAWLLVLPTAILTPLVLFYTQRGEMGEDAAVGWGVGVILLAMMMGGDKAKLRANRGAKFEYVGMLAIMGGFVGIPAAILGTLVLWMFDMFDQDHAMAIGSAIGGGISFVALLAYAFKSGVRATPESGGRASFDDGVYDGRD